MRKWSPGLCAPVDDSGAGKLFAYYTDRYALNREGCLLIDVTRVDPFAGLDD